MNTGRGPYESPFLRVDIYGSICVGMKELTKSFPLNANEALVSGPGFRWQTPGGCSGGVPGVLDFWSWSCCICQATNLVDFSLLSFGLFEVERQFRQKIRRRIEASNRSHISLSLLF